MSGAVWQVGVADLLKGPDAPASGVQQPYERQSPLNRHAFREGGLVADVGVRRAAADSEVTAIHHYPTAVDFGHADYRVCWREAGQITVRVVSRRSGQGADLFKTAGVDQ